MLYVLISILAGVLYGNLAEWVVHRFILHGWGKKKGSWLSTHWRKHHRSVRRTKGHDPDYLRPFWGSERAGEVVGLSILALLHLPLFFLLPVFYATLVVWTVIYYAVHRKSHLDPAWGRKYVPWHWDHHMGKNQNMNWGVVLPIWDWVFRTRRKYE